jgi:inward rectifier potassium channel
MDTRQNPRAASAPVGLAKATRVRVGSYEFEKRGISRFDLRDPYHLAVTLSWPQFLASLLTLYMAANLVFATLFWLVPGAVKNARPGSFSDAFFFSMETLATVGYGEMSPSTAYGRVIAGGEIVCGLAFTAILTGLTFVRFSRPRAKVVFAANPVIATHKGKPTLMLRVGNGRAALLLETTAKLNILTSERTADHKPLRRARELRLERAQIPAFPLSWTLMHVIDEQSPLHGLDAEQAVAAEIYLFVLIETHDPSLSATVQEIRAYAAEDLRFGMRYADVVAMTKDGRMAVDLTRIGALEPDDGGDYEEQGWSEREDE